MVINKNINIFKNSNRKVNILLILTLFAVISKIFLLGNGMLSNPDEWRYLHAIRAVKMLSAGEVKECLYSIFSTDGRPGEVIIKMIPATIQIIFSDIVKLNILETNAFIPVYLFNFVIYLLLLIVHFRFTLLISESKTVSLLSVLLYATLTNSSLYLRHNFPYDLSLLIFYYVIYSLVKALKNNESGDIFYIKKGILGFFAYLIYPGYVFLFVVCLGLIALNQSQGKLRRIRQITYFLIGCGILLTLAELASRIGGRPYIVNAFILSGTIIQGSFEETLTFVFKYLWQVEGFMGLLILVGLAVYLWIHKNQLLKSQENIILITLILLMLLHGVLGLFFHKIVFYGRLLHQYLPFLTVFSIIGISEMLFRRFPQTLFILAACSALNSVVGVYNLHNVRYPRDYAWSFLNLYGYYNINQYYGFNHAHTAFPKLDNVSNDYGTLQELDSIGLGKYNADIKNRKYLMVNSCFILPSNKSSIDYFGLFDKNGYTHVIDSSRHYINLKAYQFEGYKIEERKFLDSVRPRLYFLARNYK